MGVFIYCLYNNFWLKKKIGTMWNHVKGHTEIQVNGIGWSSLINWCGHSIIEDHQTGQTQFTLGEAMLAVFDHLLILHVP